MNLLDENIPRPQYHLLRSLCLFGGFMLRVKSALIGTPKT